MLEAWRVRTHDLGHIIPAAYRNRLAEIQLRLEFGSLRGAEGTSLQFETPQRRGRQLRHVFGLAAAQVALRRDVQPHRLRDLRSKPPVRGG